MRRKLVGSILTFRVRVMAAVASTDWMLRFALNQTTGDIEVNLR